MHKTLNVEEDNAESIQDTVSAGGTRYIVGVKGGLKFYGQNSASNLDAADSISNYSKSRGGGPLGDIGDSASRLDYDGSSLNNGSQEGNNRRAHAGGGFNTISGQREDGGQ